MWHRGPPNKSNRIRMALFVDVGGAEDHRRPDDCERQMPCWYARDMAFRAFRAFRGTVTPGQTNELKLWSEDALRAAIQHSRPFPEEFLDPAPAKRFAATYPRLMGPAKVRTRRRGHRQVNLVRDLLRKYSVEDLQREMQGALRDAGWTPMSAQPLVYE